MSLWFCPECYSVFAKGGKCACTRTGAQHILFSAPGEIPLVLGHLTLLDDTPRPWSLLEGICDGPRRYPAQAPTESRCCCWRHKARTVWVWQDNAENLPAVGLLPDRDANSLSMSLLRVMTETSLLLIEAPQQTPLFRAHYERNKSKGQGLPKFAMIIDRLQWVFSLSSARNRAIALLDTDQDASAEDRLRLAEMGKSFAIFEKRAEAFHWLLKKSADVSQHPRLMIYQQKTATREKAPDITSQPLSSARPSAKKEDGESKQSRPPDFVRVVDVGGSVGRHLLAQLHSATCVAAEEAGIASRERKTYKHSTVRLSGHIWSYAKFQAYFTAEGLRYGRIQRLRNNVPAPGSSVPAWAGRLTRWWRKQSFTIALGDDAPAEESSPLIIGVGDSRLFGEGELSRLLERVWHGHWIPVAIIRHDQANSHLLRWIRNEFPQTPEFQDSWLGGMQALQTALRVARRRV